MYRLVNEKPSNLSIEIVDCIDRGGNHYTHPFIGCFALSRALMGALGKMGVRICNGSKIPDSFFEKYQLMECEYHPEKPEDEKFVTSDYWYTCREAFQFVELGIEI